MYRSVITILLNHTLFAKQMIQVLHEFKTSNQRCSLLPHYRLSCVALEINKIQRKSVNAHKRSESRTVEG